MSRVQRCEERRLELKDPSGMEKNGCRVREALQHERWWVSLLKVFLQVQRVKSIEKPYSIYQVMLG